MVKGWCKYYLVEGLRAGVTDLGGSILRPPPHGNGGKTDGTFPAGAWNSMESSTQAATALPLDRAGFHNHWRAAETAASFKPIAPRMTLTSFTRPSTPTSTFRTTGPCISAPRGTEGKDGSTRVMGVGSTS